jgi:VanZ family protein
MTLIRRAALLFALFLVLIIILADTGLVGAVFGWIYFFPNGDKVAHFLLWGTFSLLVSLGFPARRLPIGPLKVLKSSLLVLKSSLFVSIPVILEEVSQLFFPGRSPDLLDLAAGLLGVFLFGELGAWLRQVWLVREKSRADKPAADPSHDVR